MSSKNKIDIPENQISVSAYYIYREGLSYDKLCWILAKKEAFIELGFQEAPRETIMKRAEQIYEAQPPYDVLCWLIGEKHLYIKKKEKGGALESILSD